jgi:hypothetical protein
MEDAMDLQTIINVNVLLGLMVVLCIAVVVYGGWLCLGQAAWNDENDRRSGPRTTPPRQPHAHAFHAAGAHEDQEPMINVRGEAIFLSACLGLAGILFVLLAPADLAPTGSPVSSAAATEATHRTEAGTPALREGAATPSRASNDYFPANYVNQGRDGDGNVKTYEHD